MRHTPSSTQLCWILFKAAICKKLKRLPSPPSSLDPELGIQHVKSDVILFPFHFCCRRNWSRFLRRFRSDLTRSLLYLKNELDRPTCNVLRTGFWPVAVLQKKFAWAKTLGNITASLVSMLHRTTSGGCIKINLRFFFQ